jgi:hypothetical protein
MLAHKRYSRIDKMIATSWFQVHSQAFTFGFKTTLLRWRRRILELFRRPNRIAPSGLWQDAPVIATQRSVLWNDSAPTEYLLIAGKIENLRVAAKAFDGITLKAGEVLSFWRQLGKPSAANGFVPGRELRQGCIVPAVGGGLCQLSNGLYQIALDAKTAQATPCLSVLERHRHSVVLPGSWAAKDRDATVFWDYVDLRLRANMDCRIEVELTATELVLRLKAITHGEDIGLDSQSQNRQISSTLHNGQSLQAPSCLSCNEKSCVKSLPAEVASLKTLALRLATYLLVRLPRQTNHWPEFAALYRESGAEIFAPKSRWRLPVKIRSALSRIPLLHIKQVHRVERELAEFDEQAHTVARQLKLQHTRVLIPQALLATLWQSRALQGRRFDVILTHLPLRALHERLDTIATRHPDSFTAAEFRAPAALVAAQSNALASAGRIFTAHPVLAQMFSGRAVLLPWVNPAQKAPETRPSRAQQSSPLRIYFPDATAARNGAFELREALRQFARERCSDQALTQDHPSPCLLLRSGTDLEGAEFWSSVPNQCLSAAEAMAKADVVVSPSWLVRRPTLELRALALGLPVIASDALGLSGYSGCVTIKTGDARALFLSLTALLLQAQRL